MVSTFRQVISGSFAVMGSELNFASENLYDILDIFKNPFKVMFPSSVNFEVLMLFKDILFGVLWMS